MNINERIKTLRKELKLSQTNFAKKIGISQTNLSWMEKTGNKVMERNIRQISLVFNVNEEWLRNGTGDKFKRNTVAGILGDPTIDEFDKKILESYINMSPAQRRYIKNWIMSIVESEKSPVSKSTP